MSNNSPVPPPNGGAAPPPSDWLLLSEVFPQIERTEGERAAALGAVARAMDTKRVKWYVPAGRACDGPGNSHAVAKAIEFFWSKSKIQPEKDRAVGEATYTLKGRGRMSLRGEIALEPIYLCGSDVNRLWPKKRAKGSEANRPRFSQPAVDKALFKLADGNRTIPELKQALTDEIGAVPESSFRAAKAKLPEGRLLRPGQKPKIKSDAEI